MIGQSVNSTARSRRRRTSNSVLTALWQPVAALEIKGRDLPKKSGNLSYSFNGHIEIQIQIEFIQRDLQIVQGR